MASRRENGHMASASLGLQLKMEPGTAGGLMRWGDMSRVSVPPQTEKTAYPNSVFIW